MVCPPEGQKKHSLKLVDYLLVQADKPCYNYYIARNMKIDVFTDNVESIEVAHNTLYRERSNSYVCYFLFIYFFLRPR